MGKNILDYLEFDEEVDGEIPNPVYVVESVDGEQAIGKMEPISDSHVLFNHLDGQDLEDFPYHNGMTFSVEMVSQLCDEDRMHKLDVRGDEVEHVKEVTGV